MTGICFEDVSVGQEVPHLVKGPMSTAHLVRWCAAMENWHLIHYDWKYATQHDKLPDVMVNGTWKQNVMIQLVQKQEAPVGLGQAIKTGELSGLAVQMAVMVMALLPVAVLSPFVQRHFKKGMLTGAVKG